MEYKSRYLYEESKKNNLNIIKGLNGVYGRNGFVEMNVLNKVRITLNNGWFESFWSYLGKTKLLRAFSFHTETYFIEIITNYL